MKANQIILAPSILTADFSCLAEQIQIVEESGADWLHLDIMDGHFVPNLTFGPPVIEKLKKVTRLPLDVHLMIEQPERLLQDFQKAGADQLTIHIETGYHHHRVVEQIHGLNMKAGITLNPATPLSAIEQILPFVDLVLVMTVDPGFGGQHFIEAMLAKIQRTAALIETMPQEIWLEVDGGLDETTIPLVLHSGANALVVGSAIYGAADIPAAVKKIRNLIAINQAR